jgi:hypothetical protein
MTAPASRSADTLAPSRSERKPANSGEPFLGRHVGGLDDILDSNRHAVDGRARLARAPACRRLVGRRARAGEVEVDEGADLGLERGEIGEAAFEEIARRVCAARKARRCR